MAQPPKKRGNEKTSPSHPHDAAGQIHLYQYDSNGRLTGEKVKEGRSGTPHDAPQEPPDDPLP